VTEIDIRIFLTIHHALSGWMGPMVVLSAIGGGWGSLAVVPLVASARTRRIGQSLAIVLVVTAVTVFVLKRAVARVRPCFSLANIRPLAGDPPTDFSFPSGHSAGSFAFSVFLAIVLVKSVSVHADRRERLLRRIAAAVLALVAIGVGLSRIALGVHFPGDVLAGAILGTTFAVIGAHLHFSRNVGQRLG
jgi:undecaprenyl-diphosphatase